MEGAQELKYLYTKTPLPRDGYSQKVLITWHSQAVPSELRGLLCFLGSWISNKDIISDQTRAVLAHEER